jgi:hypothetical protein
VVKIHPLGKITEQEATLVKAAVPELTTNIKTVRSLFILADEDAKTDWCTQGVTYCLEKYEAEEKNPKL